MSTIETYRKELGYIRLGRLNQNELHIKQDGITYNDQARKLIYKRVFRNDLGDVKTKSTHLPVPKILEQSNNSRDTEFVLEFVEGQDISTFMKNNPGQAEEVLTIFEEFLASWLKYNDQNNFLESFSFDINPSNFIFNSKTKIITKIDFLSDWGLGKKDLCYYLLPFVRLINNKVISEVTVSRLINQRFQDHTSKTSYTRLFQELENYPDDSSSSDS